MPQSGKKLQTLSEIREENSSIRYANSKNIVTFFLLYTSMKLSLGTSPSDDAALLLTNFKRLLLADFKSIFFVLFIALTSLKYMQTASFNQVLLIRFL